MKVIARIQTAFADKFGVPRQSGLIPELQGKIVFEPEFRNADAVRGLEGYSHLWLIWQFSKAVREDWSPTVRPPRLGGNERMGVFATRAPFRPNALGLSCVKLDRVELDPKLGPVLYVSGVDMMDGQFLTSSRIWHTRTVTRRPLVVGRTVWSGKACRYPLMVTCWKKFPLRSKKHCVLCWRQIPARGIRMIRSASTE